MSTRHKDDLVKVRITADGREYVKTRAEAGRLCKYIEIIEDPYVAPTIREVEEIKTKPVVTKRKTRKKSD